MKKKVVILSVSNFFKKIKNTKNLKFFFINKRSQLTYSYLNKIKPYLIFVPAWHWKISEKIINSYTCIGFHPSPLPYGRGGSPIQNLIIRGHKKTEICAIKLNKVLDGGDVYTRKRFILDGSANEIFLRYNKEKLAMIKQMLKKVPKPKKQIGKVVFYKRRKPYESKIDFRKTIPKIYDFIRMLDLDIKNFPKAFTTIDDLKIIFEKVEKTKDNKLRGRFLIHRNK